MKKAFLGFLLILFVSTTLLFSAFHSRAGTTITVPDDYPTIQAAVDAAGVGDTVIVRNGTYTENVIINKNYLTIESESGAETTTVQAANSSKNVFTIPGHDVEIRGFTIKGATKWDYASIVVGSRARIIENAILGSCFGIQIGSPGNNTIANNTICGNQYSDVYIYSSNSRSNSIVNNSLGSGGVRIIGYYVQDFNTQTILGNTVNGKPLYYYKDTEGATVPEDAGQVILANCTAINVCNLGASSGLRGIELAYTSNSRICNCNISLNGWFGTYLFFSNNNELVNNTFSHQGSGIELSRSNNNTIKGNVVNQNEQGFHLYYSGNNIVVHNEFFANVWNVYGFDLPNTNTFYLNDFDDGYLEYYESTGMWNSQHMITYVFCNETYTNYLGNYWANHTDMDLCCGAFQNETGSDGIWDHPYVIDTNNQDNYPLVNPWALLQNQPPTCIVKLQKGSTEIDEIDVGEFFDIYVGDSMDDRGMAEVRFSSDDSQNWIPEGQWTQWYSWTTSSGDWNAETKAERWTFVTAGYKEVWAEVKDNDSLTDLRRATIYVSGSQPPTCVVSLQKNGIEMHEINVGEPFDINVGGSTDDASILWVLFSSDDSQDGHPSGVWTDRYGWSATSGDWNAISKIMQWSFSTPGKKEVWAMVEDSDGNPVWNHADIIANSGYAIVVAGDGGWREKWGIDAAAENAYKALQSLGFDDDHIVYLNSNRPRDVDDDGTDEVDGYAAYSYFEDALQEIKNEIAGNPTPLVVYLTGHGDPLTDGVGFFFGDWNPPEERYLFNEDLSQMLDEFSGETPMLIVLGCCHSGAFITSSISISAPNRMIVTAAHDGNRNYIGWLRSSDRFWGNLKKGLNVRDAFTEGALWGDNHNMWLDDNGDKVGHPPNDLQNDGVLSANTRIGCLSAESLTLMSWEYSKLGSPGEIRICDSMNRTTGMVNGEIKEEIPNSFYDEESSTIVIFSPCDSYYCSVVGNETGIYELETVHIEDGTATTFSAVGIGTSLNATHQYAIDWTALSQGEEGATIQVDRNGDGLFEHTLVSDGELTANEFLGVFADINSDGIVDIYDAILLANAYNSVPTSSHWNPNSDINSDNTVDIYDAIILANHYNQNYP